jgi:hypothetical protein
MFDAHSEMGQRRWNALARAPERSSDARKRMRGESAKQVAIDVLRAAGEPLHRAMILARSSAPTAEQTCANTSDQPCALTLALLHSLHYV